MIFPHSKTPFDLLSFVGFLTQITFTVYTTETLILKNKKRSRDGGDMIDHRQRRHGT